ncbi:MULTISPECIES: dTMP kinase [unclassified Pseudactinotalea]|uniref:dTMP kinase n=1 Tax=unclassified Pseudactinotalea TaxID=2649176 RepID=UPI003C7AB9FC
MSTVSGLFISFEGGDGAGKSTQVRLLAQWLREEFGREVVTTREPGGTELGRTLRNELLHGQDIDARTEALLFAADRAHHALTLIRPALARGAVVLTDRYLDSSVAYQAAGRELAAEDVERLSRWGTNGLMPALTVLLDLPTEQLVQRLGEQAADRMERAGMEFHRRTRQAFLDRAAAEPQRWLVLDAAGSREEIAQQVRAAVEPLLSDDAAGGTHPSAQGGRR